MVVLGTVIMWIGVAFMLFGIVGIFRFKNFYPRILVTSKIDTVGTLTLIIGLIIRNGFSFFSGKLLILAVIIILLNPLVSHVVARSAYMSGHKNEEVLTEDDDALE